MSDETPKFMMVADGKMYGYWSEQILYIDVLLFNKQNGYFPEIFQIQKDSMRTIYSKITKEELKTAV